MASSQIETQKKKKKNALEFPGKDVAGGELCSMDGGRRRDRQRHRPRGGPSAAMESRVWEEEREG